MYRKLQATDAELDKSNARAEASERYVVFVINHIH